MYVQPSKLNNIYLFFFYILSIIVACLFNSTTASTKEVISGNYTATSGLNQIEFLVNVGNPAPANLIVQHFHPAEIKVVSSSPQASKIERNKGSVKWFLKSVTPGILHFNLVFKKAISVNSVRTILRFRNPTSGTFTELEISP